eukprot:scaffold109749_cov63-Phaeocystis_antarctica.AAC.1
MPLELSQGVSQVQRQRHPHAMHSTCAPSLPETILASTTRHVKAPPYTAPSSSSAPSPSSAPSSRSPGRSGTASGWGYRAVTPLVPLETNTFE